jgi:hypothetical protein
VPSLQELRRVRSELEKEYFDSATKCKATPPSRPRGPGTAGVPTSPGRLPAVKAPGSASSPRPPQRRASGSGARRASKVRMDADASLKAPRPPPSR